jgi:uncharacterized damage-inducible protein DinB
VELYRFNAWANRSLLAGVRQLSAGQLDEQREGMYETVRGVLVHLTQVELNYLRMIRDEPREQLDWELPLDAIERLLEETDAGLVEAARTASPERLVRIPWFERDFSVPQMLRQVLTHSANHRADVNGWLPGFGVESTGQDYIDLVRAEG